MPLTVEIAPSTFVDEFVAVNCTVAVLVTAAVLAIIISVIPGNGMTIGHCVIVVLPAKDPDEVAAPLPVNAVPEVLTSVRTQLTPLSIET